MTTRSHLIDKPIVDRNGVQKNVKVRPDSINPGANRVASIRPATPIPVPSRAELQRIDALPSDEKARYARRLTIAPEILEMLGSSKNPMIRNEVSINKQSSKIALANVVDKEASPLARFNKSAEQFRAENLINVAMHPNVSRDTLRKIVGIKHDNDAGRDIATKRLRGEDYMPTKRVNQMATRSYHTGFYND
jgi:hypothetical protein